MENTVRVVREQGAVLQWQGVTSLVAGPGRELVAGPGRELAWPTPSSGCRD